MLLTLNELREFKCRDPRCTQEGHPIVLWPKCHEAPVVVEFCAGDDFVRLSCAVCHRHVANIAVAERSAHAPVQLEAGPILSRGSGES